MHEQYILQPTESSPGPGNSSRRGNEWSGNIRDASSIVTTLPLHQRSYIQDHQTPCTIVDHAPLTQSVNVYSLYDWKGSSGLRCCQQFLGYL